MSIATKFYRPDRNEFGVDFEAEYSLAHERPLAPKTAPKSRSANESGPTNLETPAPNPAGLRTRSKMAERAVGSVDLGVPVAARLQTTGEAIESVVADERDRYEWIQRIEQTRIYEASGIRYLDDVADRPGRYIQSSKPESAFVTLGEIDEDR